MAVLVDPFDALSSFQQALDAYRTSSWLDPGLSGGGAYPPVNVFRKGDDFIVIAELPGVKKSDLDVQVKGRTIRLAGAKTVGYPDKAALHRRERLAGRFDRAVTMPIECSTEARRCARLAVIPLTQRSASVRQPLRRWVMLLNRL